jgi:hypothetical protein
MNRVRRALGAWPLTIVLLALLASTATATEPPEIERVWSFSGGAVAIKSAGDGKFVGIVVSPTKFDECPHHSEEEMWTDITQQPDGSYWGLHQWLLEKTCEPTAKGPTAWRVLAKPEGTHYLLVCFSEPGSTQPTIAPDGQGANDSFGCRESEPVAPLPRTAGESGPAGGEVISFKKAVELPKTALCVRRRKLKIKLHDPTYDPLKEVAVHIKHRRALVIRGVQRLKKGIVLKHLPRGSFTIKITAITVLNQHLNGRARYRSCSKHSAGVHLHPVKEGG